MLRRRLGDLLHERKDEGCCILASRIASPDAGTTAAFREVSMKTQRGDFIAVLAAGAMLGVLLSGSQATAADRVPGPEATSGASTSQRANYYADYHADYRANGTESRAKGTDDDSTARRDERRNVPGDLPGDWRNSSGLDWYGRSGVGWPR
jgi:hypothetical protein